MKSLKLVTTLLVCAAAVSGFAADIALAKDGKALYTIVQRPDAARLEKASVKDLKLYLDKITGGDFKIGTADSKRIFVGVPAPGDKKPLAKAERRIKVVNGDIYLYGESTDSASWAIYDLLEEHIGCRWYTVFGDEKIPSDPNLTIPELDFSHIPSFRRYETASMGLFWRSQLVRDVLRRRRVHITPDKIEGDDDHLLGFPLHTFCKYIPSGKVPQGKFVNNIGDAYKYFKDKKYFETNPEWFTMDTNGKRVWDRQLCFSNKELRAELTKNLEIVIKNEYKGGDAVIAVDMNDAADMLCYCNGCRSMIEKYQTDGGPLYDYLIELGGIFAKKYPRITIRSLAYHCTLTPPNCNIPGNVTMWYAPLNKNYIRNHRDSVDQAAYVNMVAQGKRSKALWKWMYLTPFPAHGHRSPTLIANMQVIADNLRIASENNIKYLMTEVGFGVAGVIGMHECRMYMTTRLVDDLSRNEQAEIREFMDFFYGKAAGKLYTFLQELEEIGKSSSDLFIPWRTSFPWAVPYVTPERLIRWKADFDEMEKLVADDPVKLQRVREARMNLDQYYLGRWVDIAAIAPGHTKEAFEAYKARYLATVKKMVDRIFDVTEMPTQKPGELAYWKNSMYKFFADALKGAVPEAQTAAKPIRPLPPELAHIPADRIMRFPYLPQDGTKAPADPEGAFGTSMAGKPVAQMNFGFTNDLRTTLFPHPVFHNEMAKMPKGYNLYYVGQFDLVYSGGISSTVLTKPHSQVTFRGFRNGKHPVDFYISIKYEAPDKIWMDELVVVDVGN